jgi:hypothetical protein
MKFLPSRNVTFGDDNEEWMNLNIKKDPIKGVFTQYRNKRNERAQYEYEEEYSRYSENIEKFARGIDPMKEVQMNNTTGSKQAYKPIVNPILRVPQINQFELLPLSRLPYKKQSFFSKKTAPSTEKQTLPEKSRTIIESEKTLKPSMESKVSSEVIGGTQRKETFSTQKNIVSTPIQINKSDKIKLDYEKIRSLIPHKDNIIENSSFTPYSSVKNLRKEARNINLIETMIDKDKIHVEQASKKSLDTSTKFASLSENPSRGIHEEENPTISVQSKKNNKINKIHVRNNISREIEETPIYVHNVSTSKHSKMNLDINRNIDAINFKQKDYNIVNTQKTISKGKTQLLSNTDEFIVSSPIVVSENAVKQSTYHKINLDSFQNQKLPERPLVVESIEANKSTFSKIKNNQIKIKESRQLNKDPFTRTVGFVPQGNVRDVNVPPNVFRH